MPAGHARFARPCLKRRVVNRPPSAHSFHAVVYAGDTKMEQIQILRGDLFKSNAHTNAVNCVGVMGKGIAREFRRRFPDMYEDYVERCRRKAVQLG